MIVSLPKFEERRRSLERNTVPAGQRSSLECKGLDRIVRVLFIERTLRGVASLPSECFLGRSLRVIFFPLLYCRPSIFYGCVLLRSYGFAFSRPQLNDIFTLSLGNTGQSAFVFKKGG